MCVFCCQTAIWFGRTIVDFSVRHTGVWFHIDSQTGVCIHRLLVSFTLLSKMGN